MDEILTYNEICGSKVTIVKDDYDYEVRLNNDTVMTTSDEIEAEMVAESLDVALTILNAHNLLKNF